MEENKMAVQAAQTDRSFGSLLKHAGSFAWDLAKRAWRVDAVKSAALTWLIRASVPGAAVLVAIIDSYAGNP